MKKEQKMRGHYDIYKDGIRISQGNLTRDYDTGGKRIPALQGAVTRQAKRAARTLQADHVDIFLHFSCLPAGPYLTRHIGMMDVHS